MKKGKSCALKGYKNFKCYYGTVDSKNFKSIYLNIQSWVHPKEYIEDWSRPVSNFNKIIKSFIVDTLDKTLFENNFIVDLDLRTSGISTKKRSFMNLEVTFFVKPNTDFKSLKLKASLKKLISSINKDLFQKNKYFTFHLTKNDKYFNLID